MKNVMEYNGYFGRVAYSDEDKIFYGHLLGINDMITYEGHSVQELQNDFKNAVDDYLASCTKWGKMPQKPYKGSFNIRISSDLHAQAAILASSSGETLNKYVQKAIEEKVSHDMQLA